MKQLVLIVLLAAPCAAQYNLPPGTSSSVPQDQPSQKVAPETAALQSAEDAIAANRFEDALKLLTPLATTSQKKERVFYDLGFAQDALGHDNEAAIAYRQALTLDGDDAPARVSLGLLLARDGDVTGAEVQLRSAVSIQGADPILLARAKRALAQIDVQDHPEQARDELLAALKLSPETPQDAAVGADIAEALKDDRAAEAAYARALRMTPEDADLSLGYARVLAREKKFAEADTALDAARAAHPRDTRIVAELASEALLQGRADRALPMLQQLHASDPADSAIGLLLARGYAESGAADKADATYTALLVASPNDPVLLAEAGDALIREKRSAEAEPLLRRAMEHKDGFPSQKAMADAAGELAFAAQANHDAETTLKALATRESVAPLTAPFIFLRASAHDTLRHTREAAVLYRAFLQQSSGKFPDQEWQAQQRLKILERTK